MKKKAVPVYLFYFLIALVLLTRGDLARAQGVNTGQYNTLNGPKKDTTGSKSNTSKWKTHDARIFYKKLNSDIVYYPDSLLHTFHRAPFSQPWNRDMGNLGSPVQNLMFTPEERLGPTLGYHVMDVYRYNLDSLNYYNTTRPYSVFSYRLGSKLEQVTDVMLTENIRPNWNFSAQYRKVVSQGFYKVQRNNHDNANFTTHYKSNNEHYELFGAVVYNQEQHDENGGIISTKQLDSSDYNDRKTIPVAYQKDAYSITRSSVYNVQRDFGILLQHSYTWGRGDTLYNQDSTSYSYKLIPRFRITHKLELSSEKHDFKDLIPDSARYASLFNHTFYNGGYYIANQSDTVSSEQKWFWVDNKILLNGFLGKPGKLLEFNAGVGNRFDQFMTLYGSGFRRTNIVSNYLTGEIKKEALGKGQWFYKANAQFFLTGSEAGDFLIHGEIGKDLQGSVGNISAGFQQQLNSAPYNYTFYENQYYTFSKSFNKESITLAYGSIQLSRYRLYAGAKLYLINNYIYINENGLPAQYDIPFNLTQAWIRKVIRIGKIYLDNELLFQQKTGSSPVNIPALAGRHQLSYERGIFGNALKIVTGVEMRYNTAYRPSGYDPLLNRFNYQNSYYVGNFPEFSFFFNFKVTKRFRAFIMVDELQQIFARNAVYFPGYPAQDVVIRGGFSWVLIN